MLTVQIKMNLMDDLEARSFAKAIIDSMNIKQWEAQPNFPVVKKLQEIMDDQPPRKIEL